jgi:hypothetical protein
MKKIVTLAMLAMMSVANADEKCVPKTSGDQKDSDWALKDWIINWEKCAADITGKLTAEQKESLIENGKLKKSIKEDDVYQALLKHDKDLSQACNDNCHTQYEKATCKEG